MVKQTRTVGAVALMAVCAACAGHSSSGPAVQLTPATAKWSGSLVTMSGSPSGARSTKVNGTVVMIADPSYPSRTKIDMQIGYTQRNASVNWALLTERCGAGAPVLPITSFSPIDVGPSGRTTVSETLPLEIPTSGNYHVNIYAGRQASQADVVGCAELKVSTK